jgi:tRNA (mo5U34)-methyltransferase
MPSNLEDARAQVADVSWYHRIELPGGLVTDATTDPRRALERLHLPASLAGKSVLDVGAWDGFYSFECARRGASPVLATDSFAWDGRAWNGRASNEGFVLARRLLGLEDVVADQLIDASELSPAAIGGQFDVVLLLGVLYHLTDAVRVLEAVASCCSDLLVLETETALNWLPVPAAQLHPGAELNNDATNWYSYNARALQGLLARVGFGESRVVFRTPMYRRVGKAISGRRPGYPFRTLLRSARIVVHAHRTSDAQPPAN